MALVAYTHVRARLPRSLRAGFSLGRVAASGVYHDLARVACDRTLRLDAFIALDFEFKKMLVELYF